MKMINKLIISFMLMFVCVFGFNYIIHAESLLNEELAREQENKKRMEVVYAIFMGIPFRNI